MSGVLKGPVKESGFYKRVNVALEPTEEHKTGKSLVSSVPGYTFLKPGSNRVQVMLKNMSARPVTLHPGDQLANLEAANAIPHMLAPKEVPNRDGTVSSNKVHKLMCSRSRFEEALRKRGT